MFWKTIYTPIRLPVGYFPEASQHARIIQMCALNRLEPFTADHENNRSPTRPLGRSICHLMLAEKSLYWPIARWLLAGAYLEKAKLRRANGNVAKAVETCEIALRLNASNPDIYIHYALNLLALQHDDDSKAALKCVLALRPLDPTAMHLLNAIEQRTVRSTPPAMWTVYSTVLPTPSIII